MNGYTYKQFEQWYKTDRKAGKCMSDLTIADYWGVANFNNNWDDDKGTSVVCLHTKTGVSAIEAINVSKIETKYEHVLKNNPCSEHSDVETKYESIFGELFTKNRLQDITLVLDCFKPSHLSKITCCLRRFLSSIKSIIVRK